MTQDVLDVTDLVEAWQGSSQSAETGVETLTGAWRAQQPLGFLDAMADVVERPSRLVPFLSGASDAVEMHRLWTAAGAMQKGQATPEQKGLVLDFLEHEQRPKGIGYLAGSILAELPAFAGEFATTAGALPAGRKVATEAAEAGVGLAIKQAVQKAAKGVGKAGLQLGLMEAGSQATGAAVLGEGGSRIEADAWRRALPEMGLDADQAGKLDVVFSSTARDFYDALPAAVGSQLIEVASERSGAALGRLVGLDRLKLAQGQVARWFIGKGGDADSLVAKVAEKGGWNGVINEYLEERLGGALKAGTLVGEREFLDRETAFPGLEQQAAELLAFSVAGGAGALTERATNDRQRSSMIVNDRQTTDRPPGVPAYEGDLPALPPSAEVSSPSEFANEPSQGAPGPIPGAANHVSSPAKPSANQPNPGEVRQEIPTAPAGPPSLTTPGAEPMGAGPVTEQPSTRAQPAGPVGASGVASEPVAEAPTSTEGAAPSVQQSRTAVPTVEPQLEAPSTEQPPDAKTRKGVYRWPSEQAAKAWAGANGWPTDRVWETESGWIVQAGKSGNYAGPGETPRPWMGQQPGALEAMAGGAERSATLQPPPSEVAPRAPVPETPAPAEPSDEAAAVAPEPDTFSIKNAEMGRLLTEMGLPEAARGEKRPHRQLVDEANETLRLDPFAGQKLVKDLEKHPRAPSDAESVLLATELVRLSKEVEDTQNAFNETPSEANEARVERALEDFAKLGDVSGRMGTRAGQALAARQVALLNDYSYAAIARRRQVAKGKPLTTEERATLKEMADKIAEIEKRLEEKLGELELKQAALEAERNVRERRKARRGNREKKIEQAKRRIDELFREIATPTPQGGIPAEKIAKLVELAGQHIRIGYHSAAQFVDDVVAKLGEEYRKPAEEAWRVADNEPGLKRYKTAKHREIAERMRRLDAGEFATPKRRSVQLDAEAIKLKAESERLKQSLATEEAKEKRKRRSRKQKVIDTVREALVDLPKSIKTAWDFSAVFRQGAFFSLGHPVQTVRHIRRMIGAAVSEKRAEEINQEIRNRPLADFGTASGLELTELNAGHTKQEEAIRSHFAEKIPGVKASNRAYTTFLNLQRAAMFDRMVIGLPEPSLDAGRAIATAVNVATGRGAPGRHAQAMNTLGQFLWAPRLYLSRIQLLIGQPFYQGNAATRTAIAKEYARFLIGLSGVYMLAKFAGEWMDDDDRPTIETDTNSSDFGKIKLGETRIDPLGGLQQFVVLGARMASGASKSTWTGKTKPIRGPDVPYGSDTTWDVKMKMLRTKLTPFLGAVADVLSAENVVGDPVTPVSAAIDLVTPLSFASIADAMEDQGVRKGAALGILSIFGFGLQTFGPESKARDTQNVAERVGALDL